MRRRTLHPQDRFGHVNVTPLIDVVMCLIVFYLVVGRLAEAQRSELRLPEARSGETLKGGEALVVNVGPGPEGTGAGVRVVVDGAEIDAASVRGFVRAHASPGDIVRVRASRELTYGDVAPVIEACRAAGVGTVRLATEKVP